LEEQRRLEEERRVEEQSRQESSKGKGKGGKRRS